MPRQRDLDNRLLQFGRARRVPPVQFQQRQIEDHAGRQFSKLAPYAVFPMFIGRDLGIEQDAAQAGLVLQRRDDQMEREVVRRHMAASRDRG